MLRVESSNSVYFHDLNDRIQSEATLRESEDRFRATFEQAAVGRCAGGLGRRVAPRKSKTVRDCRYTETELLNLTFQDITYSEDLETDLDYSHQLLAGEIPTYTMEKRYINKMAKSCG